MHGVIRLVLAATSALFVAMGLAMLAAPSLVSATLGMALLTGVGLSTQIADLASFFLTLGCCMAIGLSTGSRIWLVPPIMLLGFAAVGRVLAWLLHGAAFAWDMILVESLVAGLLCMLARTPER